MPDLTTRRQLLQNAAAAMTAPGTSSLTVFTPLSPASADDAAVTPIIVRASPEIEPFVRLIEETPIELGTISRRSRRSLPSLETRGRTT